MHKFVVREIVSHVLVSLPELVARLNLASVVSWRFRDVTFHYGRPFGHNVAEFERISHETGYQVSADEFNDFLKSDFQIIDGVVEAIGRDGIPVFVLDCEDASQWELTTNSDELAADLERRGFRRGGTGRNS